MSQGGRYAVIAWANRCYIANVLETLPDGLPKRVRIQHDPLQAGKELGSEEFTFKQWADECDD